jgi:HTH-type transcriptional regulator/antitoxin HigA
MPKNELARRMNRPAPKLSAIFTGDKAITPDTALQLEKVVGVPAYIWTGLDAGIVLVFSPHLPKTYLHGATFWLARNKAVLMLTIRGSWADIFWFNLFHEIGHLLLHGKQMVFLETDDRENELDKAEQEADQFAAILKLLIILCPQ